jgi:Fe-Mn family superoxide dismutase
MEIHHGKHHQAYVDNANKALEGTEWADASVEDVLRSLDDLPEDKRTAVRNNAGGHANHSLFWQIMSPDDGGEPSGALGDAIGEAFGGVDAFKETVTQNGVTRFGSGWTWLVWDGSGLQAYSTANQDSPLMEGHVPLLGIDVWEHAYYLNYQNRRPDYLAAWWNVVNWQEVGRRFDEASSS